jgi:hypothetical protein
MRYQLLCRARKENMNINLAIVAANNHYAGFGPWTANTFRENVGFIRSDMENVMVPQTKEEVTGNTKQTNHSDFLK